MNAEKALSSCILFHGAPEDVILRDILPRCKKSSFAEGSSIFMPRDRLDSFGIIAGGEVQLAHIFCDGTQSILDVLHPPQILGLSIVCSESRMSPHHATASAKTDILFMPAELILRPGGMDETIRQTALARLLNTLASESIRREYRQVILSQKSIRARILTYLTMQSARLDSRCFKIPFSREGMAEYLCVNRSALSHELSLLRSEGYIDFKKDTFTLLRQDESFEGC